MSVTKGTHVAMKALERQRRLSTDSPNLKRNAKFTVSEAMSRLKPLSNTKVIQEDCNFAFDILEKSSRVSKSKGKDIARFIANNIILGITEDTDIALDKYDISDDNKKLIESAIKETAICNRILNNQYILEHRFNIDNLIRSNRYNLKKIISEMCELIDTYNVPADYKYNVALENILFSLVKNGEEIPSDKEFVSMVTEYFLMRDMTISDITYRNYQTVLEGCKDIFNLSNPSIIIESVLDNKSDYFRNMSKNVLYKSNDSYIREYILPKAMNIKTEADASDYIDDVCGYIDTCCDTDDEARLYCSISNIPNYTPVSKDFVTIKRKEMFDDDRFSSLTNRDCILSDIQAITEEDPIDDNPIIDLSSYRDMFKEETYATSDDVKTVIDKFKAEQDKSSSKIKQFITKRYAKSPESIIDEVPDVFSFIRAGALLCIAASSPIGPIIAGITGLVGWLISRKINDKEATRLLNTIRSEKKKIKDKIDKASSDKKKKELEMYLDCLKNCENKVVNYLDTISTDDHSDADDDNDWDDFDFEDESAISIISSIFEAAAYQIQSLTTYTSINSSLPKMIEDGAKYNFLSDLGDIIRESTVLKNDYINALDNVKDKSDNIIIRTAINRELEKCNEQGGEFTGLKSIISMDIANNELINIQEEVLNEKFNLNTVKLALQNAKAKLRDLSTKEKSMWQSVDAAGSGLVKSIEKAMTSDRREAIIKGSIIPSFSKCIKGAIALAGVGLVFGPMSALITALGGLAVSKTLNARERKLLFDEIDTELKVVEKEIELAQNDGNMKKYRFLLNYQKKLTREYQRIRYGLKVAGRDIPPAVIPGKK